MSLYNVQFTDKLILYPDECAAHYEISNYSCFFFNQQFAHNEHEFAWNLIYH